jgi:hypothetical protein
MANCPLILNSRIVRAFIVYKGGQLLPSSLSWSGVPVSTLHDLIGRRRSDGRRIRRKRPQMAAEAVLGLPVLLCSRGVPSQALLADLVAEDRAVRGDVCGRGLVETARHTLSAVHPGCCATVVDVVVTPT